MRGLNSVAPKRLAPGLHLPGVRHDPLHLSLLSQPPLSGPVSRMPARPGWPTNRTCCLPVPHFLVTFTRLLVCEHSHGSTRAILHVALSRLRRQRLQQLARASAPPRRTDWHARRVADLDARHLRFHPHSTTSCPRLHAHRMAHYVDHVIRPSWSRQPWQCCFRPSCAPPCSRPTSTNPYRAKRGSNPGSWTVGRLGVAQLR